MSSRDQANQAIKDDDGAERKSVAAKIADSFSEHGPELFHGTDGTSYTTVEVNGRSETFRIASDDFKKYLRLIWFNNTGKPAPINALNEAVGLIEAIALFQGSEHEIWVRVASADSSVWVDLASAAGEVVKITSRGWTIGPCPRHIKFLRPPGTLPLPTPVPGGSFQDLRSVINVTNDDWPLIAGWMLGAFLPGGPFPILFLNGPQNSAKTTATRIIRSLIDPNEVFADTLKSDERVLAISASHQHILCFENISSISDRISDFLCRLSTGGGFRTRALFTNQDESLFKFKRPVLINGIGDLAQRSDLLERAIIVHCPPIAAEGKRRERDVLQDLETLAPPVFGALLDGVSAALAAHDSVPVTEAVRMADFLAFVEASETAMKFEPGTFRSAYIANQAQANVIALEESPVAAAIRSEAFPGYWEGTSTQLLNQLFPDTTQRERASGGLPTTPVSLSNALKRVEPNLATIGISVRRERSSSSRLIRISKQVVTPVMASQAYTVSGDGNDDHDGRSPSDPAEYRFGGEL